MMNHHTAPIDDQQIFNLYHKPRKKPITATCSSSKPNKPDPAASKITTPCTECGRNFSSWKALFGHMRCHPERRWRGINPPPNLHSPDHSMTEEDHQVATYLLMLSSGPTTADASLAHQCSSCNKVFGSHQALGGHRASHKNVKGCFAITDNILGKSEEEHKCDICFRVFWSGKAVGGHKRCHWEKGDDDKLRSGSGCVVDLNFPPDMEGESTFGLDLRLGL